MSARRFWSFRFIIGAAWLVLGLSAAASGAAWPGFFFGMAAGIQLTWFFWERSDARWRSTLDRAMDLLNAQDKALKSAGIVITNLTAQNMNILSWKKPDTENKGDQVS